MFELTEPLKMLEQALRPYCEKELSAKVEPLEKGEVAVLDIMRDFDRAFGINAMVSGALHEMIERKCRREREGIEEKGSLQEVLAGEVGEAMDPLLIFIVMKELCRVSPSFALSLGAHIGLCGQTILAKGTSDQIENYALPLFSFEKLGCWALTEPESGSDAFALSTTAVPDGDFYVLNGSKTFITNAPCADIFVVYAKIDREDSKADKRMIHPFVLERDNEGLSVGKPMHKMGMRGSPTGQIFLSDARVHRDQLLGKREKTSRSQAQETLTSEREENAAMAWGIIERCLEESIKYAVERKQFGMRLIEFQLIQEKIARMYVHLENVRNLAFKQAWAMREGRSNILDACAAKFYAAAAAVEVGMEAIQLMGGYGYIEEQQVERLTRDAKLLMIGGGTSEIQLLNIAKELVRDKGLSLSLTGGLRN
ncbi:MAG: hypothetical protein A2W01_08865 [Candidatus Solincola sediminis]|uniref:Acyl-CoA dehydrogenase n=1 Tax=Candidatus Solincola sediminis TaxID=1797199 RepID=A0A1F2WR81_9ACTN|nr:MAG: hypothetical protein A2Y75_11195 [Candidatus Solincola sediminis]OFW60236.1 MAG: hypothetical protein A2W01_08865 [Candidatus Solincola sediminis]